MSDKDLYKTINPLDSTLSPLVRNTFPTIKAPYKIAFIGEAP